LRRYNVVAKAGTVTVTATWAGETTTLTLASGNDRVLVGRCRLTL